MDTRRREQIQRSLRGLAQSYSATMDLMQRTFELLCDEWALDPQTYFRVRTNFPHRQSSEQTALTNDRLLTVNHRGKSCFLGNTLPYRFLARLAECPNTYVSYEDLLAEVWQNKRSDSAVRSVVKILRDKLRKAGMNDLSLAIDGRVAGHYALRLPS
jgi:DNA-binding response OmpR family regulator